MNKAAMSVNNVIKDQSGGKKFEKNFQTTFCGSISLTYRDLATPTAPQQGQKGSFRKAKAMVINMLKGCQRRIIMVKDTGSRYFDSAYFVIKSDIPPSCKDSDMLSEAHKMIDAYTGAEQNYTIQPYTKPTKNRLRAAVWLGLTFACLLTFAVMTVALIKILG